MSKPTQLLRPEDFALRSTNTRSPDLTMVATHVPTGLSCEHSGGWDRFANQMQAMDDLLTALFRQGWQWPNAST